jgi:hypothetical protein
MQTNDTARPTAEERFWAKVDRNGPTPEHCPEYGNCWPRSGSNGFGYSRIMIEGRSHLATHYAWSLSSGTPFPPGMLALHVCDFPPCIRNDDVGTYEVNGVVYERRGHLWIGVGQKPNMSDAANKNRTAKFGRAMPGELHPLAKLTADDVRLIRLLVTQGSQSRTEIAERFGITTMTVSDIVCRRSWKHVE